MTTNVPPIQFTPDGLIVPPESAVLAGVIADINEAFGGNMNMALETSQGQLASSTSAIIADANEEIALFVNQVNPDTSSGFMQDAIARIYFLNRKPGTPTAVQLLCVGNLGTIIPVGAQAQDTSGNIYVCTQAGSIPVSGNITLSFANVLLGPIPCPANTVTKIYQAIPGWDTVNNPTPGVIGSNVETREDFEFRRQNSVAGNAHGSLPSIYAAVFAVPDVIDVYAYENVTDDPIIFGSTNYSLLPHSIYIGVVGGLSVDVANAIWTKKNEGSNMNGNTSVTVTDDSGYSFPQPSYPITFNRPTSTPYNFIVTIVNSASLPSTIIADVQAAVTAQFNGTNADGRRARIGSLLLAADYYGPVASCEGPSIPVQVLSIFLGSVFSGTGTLINGSETLTIASVVSGSLSAGTVITAVQVPAGTTVVRQLSGTAGGVGTYQMSAQATATVGSPEAVTGAGGTAQQIGIDQAPTIGTITVTLV